MLKLLLLTALWLSSFSPVFTTGLEGTHSASSLLLPVNDSSIKDEMVPEPHLVNGREGFKNLFESSTLTTNLAVKLNPLAISFVKGYMNSHTPMLNKMKAWGKPHFDMMDKVLVQYGL